MFLTRLFTEHNDYLLSCLFHVFKKDVFAFFRRRLTWLRIFPTVVIALIWYSNRSRSWYNRLDATLSQHSDPGRTSCSIAPKLERNRSRNDAPRRRPATSRRLRCVRRSRSILPSFLSEFSLPILSVHYPSLSWTLGGPRVNRFDPFVPSDGIR